MSAHFIQMELDPYENQMNTDLAMECELWNVRKTQLWKTPSLVYLNLKFNDLIISGFESESKQFLVLNNWCIGAWEKYYWIIILW